jgi:OOP family OmpA-OmpF porin
MEHTMRSTILVAASLATLAISAPAFAGPAEDAAYDKNSATVIDSLGNCVRTKWQDANDPCAPAPVTKHAVVPTPRPSAPVVSRENRTVYFNFNKTDITGESATKLDELAKIINESSSITDVTIHGYTDQLGTEAYNDALANKRVAVVKTYLDSKSRLKAEGDIKGLGKSSPDVTCTSVKKRVTRITCMAKERRVEIEFNAQK